MNTVIYDVANMIQELGFGTLGETLYWGRVPESKKTPTALWWLVPNSIGPDAMQNVTGEETLTYGFRLYYRSMSYREVDQKIFLATKTLSAVHCRNLNHFQTVDIRVGYSSGNFTTDSEGRTVGYAAFTVKVYDIASAPESE